MGGSFLILFVALFVVHFYYCMAKSGGGGKGRSRHRLHDDDIQKIRDQCKRNASLCTGQKEHHKQRRQHVKNVVFEILKSSGKSHDHAEKEAEEQLQKIHELKVKIHEAMGISEVEPADDGLYGGDVVLTKRQAQRLIDSLNNETESKSKRSASLFFEPWSGSLWGAPLPKWPMPIHYWVNTKTWTNWNPTDLRSIFRNAIAILSNSTKCITFVEDDAPATGNQIQFVKYGGGCETGGVGWSGPETPNVVNLGSGCLYNNIIMHETIHALGGYHEHQRKERDSYITVLKENIDPQYSSAFDIVDDSTSYGVPYNINSIMHYDSYAFYKPGNKIPTIIRKATNAADIGDNSALTPEDILQLNRMYCTRGDDQCKDSDPLTCYYNVADGMCIYPNTKSQCPRSCGLCDLGCNDKDPLCGDNALSGKCSDATIKAKCPRSCGVCDP